MLRWLWLVNVRGQWQAQSTRAAWDRLTQGRIFNFKFETAMVAGNQKRHDLFPLAIFNTLT
jgi:hypothetical protein